MIHLPAFLTGCIGSRKPNAHGVVPNNNIAGTFYELQEGEGPMFAHEPIIISRSTFGPAGSESALRANKWLPRQLSGSGLSSQREHVCISLDVCQMYLNVEAKTNGMRKQSASQTNLPKPSRSRKSQSYSLLSCSICSSLHLTLPA